MTLDISITLSCFLLLTCNDIFFIALLHERNESRSCYERKGILYRGDVNITKSGKPCVPWSTFPYLMNKVYLELKDAGSSCRNVQGYGKRPWCYTSSTSPREWEYCKIPKCKKITSEYRFAFIKLLI